MGQWQPVPTSPSYSSQMPPKLHKPRAPPNRRPPQTPGSGPPRVMATNAASWAPSLRTGLSGGAGTERRKTRQAILTPPPGRGPPLKTPGVRSKGERQETGGICCGCRGAEGPSAARLLASSPQGKHPGPRTPSCALTPGSVTPRAARPAGFPARFPWEWDHVRPHPCQGRRTACVEDSTPSPLFPRAFLTSPLPLPRREAPPMHPLHTRHRGAAQGRVL